MDGKPNTRNYFINIGGAKLDRPTHHSIMVCVKEKEKKYCKVQTTNCGSKFNEPRILTSLLKFEDIFLNNITFKWTSETMNFFKTLKQWMNLQVKAYRAHITKLNITEIQQGESYGHLAGKLIYLTLTSCASVASQFMYSLY